jgi:hypothetical protein
VKKSEHQVAILTLEGAIQSRRLAAMEHVGMDLRKKENQVAIITKAGELIEKRQTAGRSRK